MTNPHSHPMDRRRFLKGAAAGLVVLPHAGMGMALSDFGSPLPGSQLPRPDPASLGTGVRAPRSTVALIRTRDRKAGTARAMALMNPTGMAGKHVVIKPNFNTADPAPAGTHNDMLAQIVTEIQERNAREITLGESSGPPETRGVMEQKGIFDMARDMGFGVVNFDEMPEDDWVHLMPAGTHWPEGFHLPRQVVNAEYLVSTCCLKTHGFGGVFTMSLKSAVGLTPKPIRRGMHRSPDMRRMIAELNQGYQTQLILVDGVEAFTDGGPTRGELREGNVIIAGTDRVAVDAVGLAVLKELGSNEDVMGPGIFEQEQMVRAVEVGLGISGPEQIDLVSDDDEGRAYAATLQGILAKG
jgi:uncharacterized protein (DUF362 family)